MEWSSLVVKIPGVGQALETSRDPEEEPDRDRKNPSYGGVSRNTDRPECCRG